MNITFLDIAWIMFIWSILYAIFINIRQSPLVLIANYLRKPNQKIYVLLAIYSMFMVLITILFGIISYWIFYLFAPNKEKIEILEKSSQVAVSAAGFLAIIISIKIYRDTDRRQVTQITLSLFEKLRDDKFANIRDRVWEVRRKWNSDENYKIKFEKYAFLKNNSIKNVSIERELVIGDKLTIEEEEEKIAFRKDIKDVRDLFEFYSNLVIYEDVPEAFHHFKYFYYGWWRSFLYEIAEMHDKKYIYIENIDDNFIDYELYKKNMSYVDRLKRLDKMFIFNNLPHKMDLHEWG